MQLRFFVLRAGADGQKIKRMHGDSQNSFEELSPGGRAFLVGFEYPEDARLALVPDSEQSTLFFDLEFPREKARLYCTFRRIRPEDFPTASEESRRLVYFHTARAEKIEEKPYTSAPPSHTGGLLYSLEGPAATPRQLALSDSTTYFFHASLYFDSGAYEPQKADTLARLHRYLEHLMETFRALP